jgi:hypothetical protein
MPALSTKKIIIGGGVTGAFLSTRLRLPGNFGVVSGAVFGPDVVTNCRTS